MKRSISSSLRVCIALACIFVLASPIVRTQPSKPQTTRIDDHSFAAIPITDGLAAGIPNLPPLRRNLVSEVKHARITMADSLGTIYICQGKDTQGHLRSFFVHHRHDQNWSVTALDFNPDTTELLRTTFDLRPLTDKETPFPMEISMNLSDRILYYRWLLSPEVPGVPGGLPTPANAVLDVGKPLFEFSVSDLSGGHVRSSDLRGNVTVVDWWATWCSACVAEIPGYNELVRKYRSHVEFLAIAMNTPDEIRVFLAKHPFLFRQTVGPDSMFRLIGTGIPRTVVLNQQGLIVFDREGGSADTYKDVEKAIEAALGKIRE